jgi:hypothetical protein
MANWLTVENCGPRRRPRFLRPVVDAPISSKGAVAVQSVIGEAREAASPEILFPKSLKRSGKEQDIHG